MERPLYLKGWVSLTFLVTVSLIQSILAPLDIFARRIRDRLLEIKIAEWMETYSGLSEKFLQEVNRQNRLHPIPKELLLIAQRDGLLSDFRFETYTQNLLKEGYSLDASSTAIFAWWIYGAKKVRGFEKGLNLAAQILGLSAEDIRQQITRIIDAGCGKFSSSPFLLGYFNKADEILGIDINTVEISYALRTISSWGLDELAGKTVRAILGDIRKLSGISEAEGKYNLFLLEHLPMINNLFIQDLKDTFKEINNFLQDKGFIIVTINQGDLKNEFVRKIAELFRNSGFIEDSHFSTLKPPPASIWESYDEIDYLYVAGKTEIEKFLEYLDALIVEENP